MKMFKTLDAAKDYIERRGYDRATVWSYANVLQGRIVVSLPVGGWHSAPCRFLIARAMRAFFVFDLDLKCENAYKAGV